MPPSSGAAMAKSFSGPTNCCRVGIEKIAAYPCSLSLDLEELARVRGHDVADLRENLLVRSRGLNPLWEDPVTMAVNAAKPMLTEEDCASIELLIVATESSVDQGKPITTFAQRYLGVNANCRNFEAKHGCYAGTSSMMLAAHWVASGLAKDAKALVITSDQSRMHLRKPYEYVMGAGSVAILMSNQPRVLEFELEKNGYWTNEVSDTFRPTSKVEAGNTDVSVYSYLDALQGAYAHYVQKAGGDVDFDGSFKKNIYHVPFGGMTFLAHRTLLRQWKHLKKSVAHEHFAQKVLPGLKYTSQLGGTYSSSTFLSLMGLLDSCEDLEAGDRLGIFSYGSGCCGEFYSARVCPEAKDVVAKARLQELIDARQPLSVDEYEKLEQQRYGLIDCGDFEPKTDGLHDVFKKRYERNGYLILKGVAGHFREYGWS
ncbi:MAG: hydroxymethylglutaryl-CoA synthase [Pseudomonadota bacterium]